MPRPHFYFVGAADRSAGGRSKLAPGVMALGNLIGRDLSASSEQPAATARP